MLHPMVFQKYIYLYMILSMRLVEETDLHIYTNRKVKLQLLNVNDVIHINYI